MTHEDLLSRKRPRDRWRGQSSSGDCNVISFASDNDNDECNDPRSDKPKRRRCSVHLEVDGEGNSRCPDYDPSHLTLPGRLPLNTTSTAKQRAQAERTPFEYEDWEVLKESFAKAVEHHECDSTTKTLPLLRGVVHECHRFLISYQDPSVLFIGKASRQQNLSNGSSQKNGRINYVRKPHEARKCECPELPTAFHAILGTTLFLFGNLIAQDSTLALLGEPQVPYPYWLAALDVFETGENLPSRTSGQCGDTREDWRMAIMWGRTLVCLADLIVTRSIMAKTSTNTIYTSAGRYTDEPAWPPESPFSVIAARRPPSTRRMSLSWASANDLMILAIDQFSRGIFHMPHPQHHSTFSPSCALGSDHFSRTKELFTIASAVLGVAERPGNGAERQDWASWADSVFGQMEMEADMDVWRGSITRARGRCWVVVGSARAKVLEAALERGEMDVLFSEAAQDARDALTMATSFFRRAKGSSSSGLEPEYQVLRPLIAEAFVTLANLTVDDSKRKELYSYAQTEIGNIVGFENGEEPMGGCI